MSAAPVYPNRRPVRQAPPRRRRPAPRKSRRAQTGPFVVTLAFVAVSLFAVAFGFSSLLGHSLMEHARHEANKATSRARSVKDDVAKLAKKWDRLYAMRATDEWSRVNGLVAPYQKYAATPVVAAKPAAEKPARVKPQIDVVAVRLEPRHDVQ